MLIRKEAMTTKPAPTRAFLYASPQCWEWFPDVASEAAMIAKQARPESLNEEGYYGIPLIKQPTWRWQIAWYFFLEAISAGSFLVSAMGEFLSKRKLSRPSRAGFYLSFAALVPCPPLLIADLGDPKRFHHMLRIFKPVSPMSIGSWTLTLFGAPMTLLCLKQAVEDFRVKGSLRRALDKVPRGALIAAGTPGALTMCCYTGVLLSTTSNPLWHRSRYLGPLFACTALGTGVSALSLVTMFAGRNRVALKTLRRIHKMSAAVEMAAAAAYIVGSRKAVTPLLRGRLAAALFAGVAGMLAPLLVPAIPCGRSKKHKLEAAATAIALAGGLALKWAVVYAGRTSALKSNSARIAMITEHS